MTSLHPAVLKPSTATFQILPRPFRIERAHWREVGYDTDDLIPAIQRDVALIGLAAAADVADAGTQRVPTADGDLYLKRCGAIT